jgi:hypothetical protein
MFIPPQTLALRVVQRTPSEKRHPFFEPFAYVRATKKDIAESLLFR